MCSAHDDPSTHDIPIAQPRRYVLAGSEPPKPSAALAVIGEMLDEYETAAAKSPWAPTTMARWNMAMLVLRVARQRIADAEAGR